jgi:hypothetical protein
MMLKRSMEKIGISILVLLLSYGGVWMGSGDQVSKATGSYHLLECGKRYYINATI